MATGTTLLQRVLRKLVDPDQDLFDNDTEILDYFNDILDMLSVEVATWIHREFGRESTTLSYATPTHYAALPSDFMLIAKDNHGRPKVFNNTNNYSRMSEAQESQIDSWRNEGATDTGTPGQFYIIGTNLYIHARPAVNTTLAFDYFPLQQITALGDTIPWNGFLDRTIEAHLYAKLLERAEMVHMVPLARAEAQQQQRRDFRKIYKRQGLRLKPAAGYGFGHETLLGRVTIADD